MEVITFNCETITPMFLAGADGKTPELRPPSIKAAMRFWWRALNGHLTLPDLKKEEAKIFGGSGENEGRSKFAVRVKRVNGKKIRTKFPAHNISIKSKGKTFPINILDYLAYGTQEYKKGEGQVFIREYFDIGTFFDIEISYFDNINIDFNNILGLLSQVGGLGSRSRNGFGRFNIKNSQFDFYSLLKGLSFNKISEYLAFNNQIKLFKTNKNFSNWSNCLAELGIIYKSSREYLEPRHQFEKRQMIASPIMENKRQVSLIDRHSKPYFFAIKKNTNNQFEGYILFIPYQYLSKYENPPKPIPSLQKDFLAATTQLNQLLSNRMGVII